MSLASWKYAYILVIPVYSGMYSGIFRCLVGPLISITLTDIVNDST